MWLDFVSTIIFVVDYVLRLVTADYKLEKGSSLFLYHTLALADLLCVLPSSFLLNSLRLDFAHASDLASSSLFAILKISEKY